MGYRGGTAGVLTALLAAPLHAQPAEAADADTDVLEQTRSGVRSTAEWLARGVDSWFGDRPFEDGGEVRNGVLSIGVLKRPRDGTDFNVRFNARFRLPNLERRAYLFVGRDDPRDIVEDKPGAVTRQQRLRATRDTDNSFFAGLGLTLRDTFDVRLGLRRGIKPYVQARYLKPWAVGAADLIEFRQTFFWSVDDHLGSTTALSYEHPTSDTTAVRWLTSGTWTQAKRRFEWTSNLGLYRSFGYERQLALEAIVSGATHSGVDLTDYGVQTRWSQPIHKDWLIGEVIVGRFWPRDDANMVREGGWALGGAVRLKF